MNIYPTNGTIKNSIKFWRYYFKVWWPKVLPLFIEFCPECGRLSSILWWTIDGHENHYARPF